MSIEDDYPDQYTVNVSTGWRSMSWGVIDRSGILVAQFNKQLDARLFLSSHPECDRPGMTVTHQKWKSGNVEMVGVPVFIPDCAPDRYAYPTVEDDIHHEYLLTVEQASRLLRELRSAMLEEI